MNKLLWGCFWIACAVIAVAIATRLWAMRLLADSYVRQRTQIALETVADREGWFISDITIRAVERDTVVVRHRLHVRGQDPVRCYSIPLQTLELLPCGI